MARSIGGMLVGFVLVGCAAAWYPAAAAASLQAAPAGAEGLADGLLCLAPLLWSPVPALAFFWGQRGSR